MRDMRTVLAVLLLASTAHAGNHEVSMGSAVRTLRTDSANALTEDSLAGGGLSYAHALDLSPLPGLGIWAVASIGGGDATGRMFQSLTTEISTTGFSLGGRVRYPLRRWLVASGRIDLGSARASVAIRDDQGHSASDSGWGATAAGALGIEAVASTRSSRFSLGLRFELGYLAASPIGLTATPESGSDGTLQLQMSAASLGSLNLSGAVFAVSVISQF